MIVERIDYPVDEQERKVFEELCDYMETLDFNLTTAAGSEYGVLCLRLREPGKETTSLVTMPLDCTVHHEGECIASTKEILKKHIEIAADRLPKVRPVEPWPEGFTEMAEKPKTPKVGVGVMVTKTSGVGATKDTRVLLGLRKNSHGAGEWSFPGGHLDLGESPEACARRELMEETGIAAKDLNRRGWSNDVMPDEGLHYVTLFLATKVAWSVSAELKEPDKFEEWRWFPLDRLPGNIFGPTASLLKAWKLPDRMFS